MTAAQTAWITAAELSRESGLREDLVHRFVPANTDGPIPLYSSQQILLAQYVKRLTDLGSPAAAIDISVREFRDAQFTPAATESRPSRRRLLLIAGAAALVALLVGGVAGGFVGAKLNSESHPQAQPHITAIPAAPDPVCAKWAPQVDSYNDKERAWTKTDPSLYADQWSPEQRALTESVIPVFRSEVEDLRELAGEAKDPYLASLLEGQAVFEETLANRLPNYQVSDRMLWEGVIAFSGAVRAMCLVSSK